MNKEVKLTAEQIKEKQFLLDDALITLEDLKSQKKQLEMSLEMKLPERITENGLNQINLDIKLIKEAKLPEEIKKLKLTELEVQRVQYEKMKELNVSELQTKNTLSKTISEIDRISHNIIAYQEQIKTGKQPK